MFNKMFFNIGKSIKILATFLFVLEIFSGIIGGILMIFNAEYFWILISGILTILLSPVIAFASICLIYGFGEVICPLCHNVLDCGDKIGLQNCSHCGCPIKVLK